MIALLVLASACTSNNSYKISGIVEGAENGTKVIIIPIATHQDENPIAETTIIDGKFEFSGVTEQPIACAIKIGQRGSSDFMLENCEMEFRGKLNERGTFEEVELTGSEMSDLFKKKMHYRDSMFERYYAYYNRHLARLKEIETTKDKRVADSLRKVDSELLVADETKHYYEQEAEFYRNFTLNKDSFWGPLLVLRTYIFFNDNDKKIRELYNSFSDEAKESHYGQLLKKQLFKERMVGKELPEFSGLDKNGIEHQLKELCKGKKYVILDFWASWCGPCRKSIPALKEFYEKYAPKGVEIIGISIDNVEANWKKALEQEQLPWPNILDHKLMNGRLFLVRAIPAMFVVNEDGVIVSDEFYNQEERAKWCEVFDKL